MLKMVHIANVGPDRTAFAPVFIEALQKLGELRLVNDGAGLTDTEKSDILRESDVALLGWNAAPIPPELATSPGRLKYVCNVTGELKFMVPPEIVAAGIPVSNWGDAPAIDVAEGTMTLLLAALKDLHEQVQAIRSGRWDLDPANFGGTLFEANLGIYGCGVIGQAVIAMLRPFSPVIRVYDPFCAELPDGCIRVESLHKLFASSEIVTIHAGLTEDTTKSVTAELLALLPRHGVLINTARGAIVEQDALFAELRSGRLRAGLDVLDPDSLPEDHEARSWTNLILTGHRISRGWPTHDVPPERLLRMHRICVENLERFARGEPLRFVMDPARYARST
ncbi:MAG: NAD(P)-dependent oxidoreductase [Verrucomicrobia bacterium]|nr:NAD(P)-dependent oxidoreductase [Verrucomicrobiota bacterium]MDA1087335.1 NAD(P)-dependent oxidoreductase [Verrucomicrobiota bacterium]